MKKYTLTFHEVSAPITEAVTKFGGQPVWLTEPQWPLSRKLGVPMQFICQIRLYPELFGDLEAQMAYVFMTDDAYVYTSDPDAGENAVILQPGIWDGPTLSLTQGPSLYTAFKQPCEFAVELHPGEDSEELRTPWPDMTEEELEEDEEDMDDEAWAQKHRDNPTAWDIRYAASQENKIGGIPVPTTNYDKFPYPAGGPWLLLLQLNEDEEQFIAHFAADGAGYALLSEDGRVGKFLWSR